MHEFKYDKDKAIATLLFIAKRLIEIEEQPDFHRIFKILYFADQKHLVKYGRPIVGDYYAALSEGPVPSAMYDMLKEARGNNTYWPNQEDFSMYFTIRSEYYTYPEKEPDMDEFSDSDIECLNEAIEENGHLSYDALKNKSHDEAYESVSERKAISILKIAEVGGASQGMIEYIKLRAENSRCFD